MAIEKANDDVTYVGADGVDRPLITGKWYQGFYSNIDGDGHSAPGIVAYWDGDQFLDAPDGNECEMHSYDYLVEAEIAVRPKKTPVQVFNDMVIAARKAIVIVMDEHPGLKNVESCIRKAGEAVDAKNYLEAHVWYLMASSYALGTDKFPRCEEQATDARTLAFAKFSKGE